jgi:hypothetical protein
MPFGRFKVTGGHKKPCFLIDVRARFTHARDLESRKSLRIRLRPGKLFGAKPAFLGGFEN